MVDVVVHLTGWGSSGWGEGGGWGDGFFEEGELVTSTGEVFVTAPVFLPVTGFGLTASMGNETVTADANAFAAGFNVVASKGFTEQVVGFFTEVNGFTINTSTSDVHFDFSYHMTGLQANTATGQVIVFSWYPVVPPDASWTPVDTPSGSGWSPVERPPIIWTKLPTS